MKNIFIGVTAALVFVMLTGEEMACARQTTRTPRAPSQEHRPGPNVEQLDPERYWYYELLGKLRDVKSDPDFTRGAYMDRLRPVQFVTSTEGLRDAAQRTKGYISAIATILGYMSPGAIPDNEANRRYLFELTERMRKATGKSFSAYDEWRNWFEANRDYLDWSEERQLLVSKREQPQP